MKRLKPIGLLLFAAIFLAGIFPTFAQDTAAGPFPGVSWALSLYDQSRGTITRVGSAGEDLGVITLPIPEGFDFYNYNFALSPAKDSVAYLVSQVGDGSNPVQPSKLLVYDAAGQSLPVSYDLNTGVTREGINAAGTSLHFNNEGTRILTAYYFPMGENTYGMELVALDTMTGAVVNALNNDLLTATGIKAGAAYYTQVLSFQGDNAILILRPVFVADETPALAINWNVATNEVTTAAAELVNATDYAPATGDAMLLTYDPEVDKLAEGETRPENTLLPPNTVQLFNVSTSETQTLYSEDTNFISAKFIQNGERVLIFADSGARGIVIGRNGARLAEFQSLPGADMTFGVAEGFVYGDVEQPGNFILLKTDDDSFAPGVFYTSSTPFTSYSVR